MPRERTEQYNASGYKIIGPANLHLRWHPFTKQVVVFTDATEEGLRAIAEYRK